MSLALLSDPGINHTTANDDHLQLRAITSLYPDTSALGIQTIRNHQHSQQHSEEGEFIWKQGEKTHKQSS